MPYFEKENDEELLAKELKSGKLSNVYLIYGNDSFLKHYYFEKLSSLAYSGDPFFNFQKFGYDCDMQDVYDAVNQFPMMADSKCVVLNDYDIFSCSKDEFDKLCKLVTEVEEGCVLIIMFDFFDFSQKTDSKVKRLREAVASAGGRIYELNHRVRGNLIRTLMNGAKKRNVVLAEKDAAYLVDAVGEDLNILSNELEKLCNYTKTGTITREDIENVSVWDINASVYDYVGCITDGNVSKALKLLDKMFYMRTEPLAILFNIGTVYVDMYRALAAKRGARTRSDIVKDFAYPSNKTFVVDRANRYISRFDFDKIDKSFDCLIKTDRALKRYGGDQRQLLEQTTVELADILWG